MTPKIKFSYLYFEITHFCNQGCQCCYLDCGTHQKQYPLSTDEIKTIIRKFQQQGGNFITITGGEPFSRKDIFEILDYIESLDINFLVATNTILLNEDKIKKLAGYQCLYMVHTSLLGSNADEHQSISGNNSFAHILKTLVHFDKYENKTYLQVTLAKNLITKTPAIAQMLEQFKCTVKFTPVADLGIKVDNKIYNELILPESDYAKFLQLFNQVKNKYGDKIENHNLLNPDDIAEMIKENTADELYSLQYAGLVVRPNGRKSFSYDLNNPADFGSALEQIEIDQNEYFLNYINCLKEVDQKILTIAKNKTAVNYYNYQDLMMKECLSTSSNC